MADTKTSSLTALAGADVAVGDLLYVIDVSAAGLARSKKITIPELIVALNAQGVALEADLGTAAAEDVGAFATAAQGATADTALQPAGNGSSLTGITAAQIGAGILAGNMTLGEAAGQILLDPALSADGKWSGICESGTAGATLAFGDLCYFAAADSRWELADASAASTSGDVQLGVCVLAAASDGDPTMMLRIGKVRADTAFPTFTVGAPVYASETAGDVTETAPTATDSVMRRLGFAVTADAIYFNPSNDYLTHV